MTRVRRLADVDVPVEALPSDEVVAGAPAAGTVALATIGGAEVGLWRMTEGTATDVEVDEAFVVLSGRATIRFAGGEAIEIASGDLVTLVAGERTEWTVHEALTKLYVA
ncbi:cupin domain-containing protein [Agrococcus sp. SGAir0287]|uniref:cupin domain-containing protein n=1 Tax=Agrococcus sp. SGAir0287 TaxID=2070347 RepID=UPI0010CCB7E4|nr:cupin domain-containing protein [Agrococcus sp. SGAir0287]QCR19721.1 cupin [Agrococcus sp. SGAir0287]